MARKFYTTDWNGESVDTAIYGNLFIECDNPTHIEYSQVRFHNVNIEQSALVIYPTSLLLTLSDEEKIIATITISRDKSEDEDDFIAFMQSKGFNIFTTDKNGNHIQPVTV